MRFLLVAALGAALFAATAWTAPFTNRLDGVAASLAIRVSSTPAETRAVAKAKKVLTKRSTSLAGDLAMASSLAKILDKAFTGDPEFGGKLDTALVDFRADVQAGRDSLAGVLPVLPPGPKRAAGEKNLARADALLAALDDLDTRALRFAQLAKALKSVDKGTKAALGAGDWVVATANGEPFQASTVTVTAAPDAATQTWSFGFDAGAGSPRAPTRHIVVSATGVTGPGATPLNEPGEGDYSERDAAGATVLYRTFGASGGGAGILTLTRFDTAAHVAEGSFSFLAMQDGHPEPPVQVQVQSGRFHVRWK